VRSSLLHRKGGETDFSAFFPCFLSSLAADGSLNNITTPRAVTDLDIFDSLESERNWTIEQLEAELRNGDQFP